MSSGSSEQLALGAPERAERAARDPDRRAELSGAGASHQGVEVEVPAIEPVGALLRRGDGGVGRGDLLGALLFERRDARPQRLELGELVDRHRFSATCGASRANAHTPSTAVSSTTASGISSRGAPPIASAAPEA